MVIVDAWFCECHGYNRMRNFNCDVEVGENYFSWETCRRCGSRSRREVRAGYLH